MNLPYQIVKNCLQELQNHQIPLVEKLQIEIELLQVKRLLLVIDGESWKSTVVTQLGFEAFEAAFLANCSAGGEEGSTDLMSLIKDLRAAVTAASEQMRSRRASYRG